MYNFKINFITIIMLMVIERLIIAKLHDCLTTKKSLSGKKINKKLIIIDNHELKSGLDVSIAYMVP